MGQYASPRLYDVNADNLLDLIIGSKEGRLSYYKNIGSLTSPKFQLVTNQLGAVDVSNNSPDGYATPCLFEKNDTLSMFVGSFDGSIDFYYNLNQSQFETNEVFVPSTTDFLSLKNTLKQYCAIAIGDIDNDGNLDMFIGQDLGGVFYLEHSVEGDLGTSFSSSENEFQLYPNPANDYLQFRSKLPAALAIYNELGQLIYEISHTVEEIISVESWPKGLYFAHFYGTNRKTMKIVKY